MSQTRSYSRGFKQTGALVAGRVRTASEGRGFAQSRVLTHWDDIVGADIAAVTRPVSVKYGRGGLGATLLVLTTGAAAPLVDARREELRGRINATYGYNAIARIRVTQTAATGFADGAVDFAHRGATSHEAEPSDTTVKAARDATRDVADTGLRDALERLATNVLSKTHRGRM